MSNCFPIIVCVTPMCLPGIFTCGSYVVLGSCHPRKTYTLALENLLQCSESWKDFILHCRSALSVYCEALIVPRRFSLNIAPLGCDMVLELGCLLVYLAEY